jgi:hypothetical protein
VGRGGNALRYLDPTPKKNHPMAKKPADQSPLARVPDSTIYLDTWNQIRIETRTAPTSCFPLDPELPPARSDVFDLAIRGADR